MNIFCEIRDKANLTQEQIGEKIGVTNRSYSHYENGRRTPSSATAKKLIRLTKTLGIRNGRKQYTLEDVLGAP